MPGNHIETERRKGLHEIAEAIDCLREEFKDGMALLNADITWREEHAKPFMQKAEPTLETVRHAMHVLIGASSIISVLSIVIGWIFVQSYDRLQNTSVTAYTNAKTLEGVLTLLRENAKNDDRQDTELKELRRNDFDGIGKHK